MPSNDADYQREYMRKRREAKDKLLGKPIVGGGNSIPPEHREEYEKKVRDTRVTKIEPEVIEATEVGSDRANGLPRTNYYGDWVGTIQKMSSSQIQKILDHPSIKTSSRDKK